MKYVRFGSTGLRVSRLCLGCMSYGSPKWRPWVLDEEAARPFVKQAVEAGINFFDTADVYSLGASEEIVGRLIREIGLKRDELVLATKVMNPMGPGPNQSGLSRKHVMEGIDASLRRLKMDYVDLYQIHRFDPMTPIEETVEALNDVVRAGKALYVGASSMWAWQFVKMLETQRRLGLARFVSMQNFYNLIYREEEREMMPLCAAEGMAVIPWSPLARGFLARTASGGENATTREQSGDSAMFEIGSEQDVEVRGVLHRVAERLGEPPGRVALAWVLAKPFVTAPIVGATKPHHIPDALGALELVLDAETIAELESPYRPKPVVANK
jgi:aryl-alcohol dehydrogenase-like predicted oxidoreductase